MICEDRLRGREQIDVYLADRRGQCWYGEISGASPAYREKLFLNGAVWTYRGSYTDAGHTALFRTINRFAGDREWYEADYSRDGGRTWKRISSGTAMRKRFSSGRDRRQ